MVVSIMRETVGRRRVGLSLQKRFLIRGRLSQMIIDPGLQTGWLFSLILWVGTEIEASFCGLVRL